MDDTKSEIKPEMKRILTVLFDTPEGAMRVTQIAEMLEMKGQKAQYYVDKLEKEGLVDLNFYHCYLSAEGRAYVMEKLGDNL